MTHQVIEMSAMELQLVSGAVTMNPDGKSCTEQTDPKKSENPVSGMNQGGPLTAVLAVLS